MRTTCCIAGGGPAGVMLGLLLARAGVDTVVLEKHRDFLRDFRGDTVHPSTLDVMAELGLLERFLALPHQKVERIRGQIGDEQISIADFSHLPTRCRFIVLMPQWDFLSFLAKQAEGLPTFKLHMQSEVTDVLQESGRVTGVCVIQGGASHEIHADLVIGADGRHSTVRRSAGLEVEDLGSPIDVLWLRLERKPDDPPQALGYFNAGSVFITLDRGDYWQCAFVIRKDGLAQMKERGLEAFRTDIARIVPGFADRVDALASWDDIKLLTVTVDRLKQWWRPGLLCIGDSAHAMSPIGGVGINLAIQDAVATANRLARPLSQRRITVEDLAAVQQRRTLPTRLTQRLQVLAQNRVIYPVLKSSSQSLQPPAALRAFNRWPWLQRIPARLIGVGVRPEHVRL